MEIHIKHSRIDFENTKWCCDELKNCRKRGRVIPEIGWEPEYVFNWDKLRIEKVNNGIMMGCGGFGDHFWGDEVKVCPFCGKKLGRNKFVVNGKKVISKKELRRLIKIG
jgi:hypothetical protein